MEHLREERKNVKVQRRGRAGHSLRGLSGLFRSVQWIKLRLLKHNQLSQLFNNIRSRLRSAGFRSNVQGDLSGDLSSIDEPVPAIVTQEGSHPHFAPFGQSSVLALVIGLGLVVVVLWWFWPRTGRIADIQSLPTGTIVAVASSLLQGVVTPAPDLSGANAGVNNVANGVTNVLFRNSVATSAPGKKFKLPSIVALDTPQTTLLETPVSVNIVSAEPVTPTETVIGNGQPSVVLLPTNTPVAEARLQEVAPLVAVPQVRVIPAIGIELPPTPVPPTPTFAPPTKIPPTPIPINLVPGRLWATFAPAPPAQSDHFWVGRPFAPEIAGQLASPNYAFGSTAGGSYRMHHGADISNPFGTPVLAAVAGQVVHAGLDDPTLLGPYNNFYGNAVVILLDRKLAVANGQLDVFVLYGHLSQVNVVQGQTVQPGDVVGLVGMTGIAIGPHLHVEMRLGENDYQHSINPYLWLQPLASDGAVAVRLLTADGRTWPEVALTLARFEGNRAVWGRQIDTYLDIENIGPDPAWGENGAMDGVPEGYYYLFGTVNGERVRAEFWVKANETTFVELRTKQ